MNFLRLACLLLLGAVSIQARAAGVTDSEREAARKEGSVTWYAGFATATAQEVAAAAQKALGIRVEVTRMGSGQLYTRLSQEISQHIDNADVINTNIVQHFQDLKARKLLLPFTPASIDLYRDPAQNDPDQMWHVLALSLGTFQYNPERLKGDMVPHTWKALLDPKYKGKIVQGDPRLGGGFATDVFFLTKLYGWEYFDGLKRNDVLSLQTCDGTNMLASGERLIDICDHQLTPPAQAKGIPIETMFPEDGVFVSLMPVAILARAPHPNAAKLFVDWLLSSAGQAIIVGGGVGSPLESKEINWPAKYPPLASMKLMVIDPAEYERWAVGAKKKWDDLFGG